MLLVIGCYNENSSELYITADEVSLNAIIAFEKGKEDIFRVALKGRNEFLYIQKPQVKPLYE